MPSKEHLALVEKVARDLATLNEGTEDTWENYHADAQKACSTIHAALQEPTEGMIKSGAQEVDWYDHNAIDCWRAMLAASALGGQSE